MPPDDENPAQGVSEAGDPVSKTVLGTGGDSGPTISRGRLWAAGMLLGLLAAGAGWGIGELFYSRLAWDEEATPFLRKHAAELSQLGPRERGAYLSQVMVEARGPSEARHTAAAYGVLGGLLGLAAGVAGGMGKRFGHGRGLGGLVGLVLGGAAGAIVSLIVVPIFFQVYDQEKAMILSVATHGAIWMAVGFAAGLAMGVGLGGSGAVLSGILGGCLGGLLAALVFEMANSAAFPLTESQTVVPREAGARLLAHLSVAVFVVAGAIVAVSQPAARPSPRRSNSEA
jgi:hypothetical protein